MSKVMSNITRFTAVRTPSGGYGFRVARPVPLTDGRDLLNGRAIHNQKPGVYKTMVSGELVFIVDREGKVK